MEANFLTTILLPGSLFIIMLGMGLSLSLEDFKRVVKYPRGVMVGLFNQMILLPIIGFTIAVGFRLSPEMAVGLMILSACPGGTTSNLITHVAKGDTALSITLTAIASFVTVFTIPLITNFGLSYFLEASSMISLPFLKTIAQIVGITVLPVSIGMIIRRRNKGFADRMEKPARIASTIIFVTILMLIVVTNWTMLITTIQQIGLVCFVLNASTMLTGYLAARLFNFDLKQALSVVIESGIQNGTLAIVVASSILLQPEMAIPAAIYSVFMFLSGGLIMFVFGRRRIPALA
jgi:BASS family bile acid:Na+ symporter